MSQSLEKATFAGGCFWCMQQPFEKLAGVTSVVVGYANGKGKDPVYQDHDYANKGFVEAVQITFNPETAAYESLLNIFLQQIDPTDKFGQFGDRGKQYRPAILYHNQEQKTAAEKAIKELEESRKFNKPIGIEVAPFENFYAAEEFHQSYYEKNPASYERFKVGSGRDAFIKKYWKNNFKKPEESELQKKLTPVQFEVTQKNGTEKPFYNEYNDNQRAGIYVDIVSGEPLYSSLDKYDAGCGWPSFTKPLESGAIVEKQDMSHGMVRTEVRSTQGDSHLGHVFNDGPAPTGLRYCINSAALRFIPVEDLEKEGYGNYKKLFEM